MLHRSRRLRRGFSLVELLAVVLILAVLAAVAIPLYINTRRSSAARACKGNLASIASAQAAFALRNGEYAATQEALVSVPEGLTQEVFCPLDGTAYSHTVNTSGALTIACPNGDEDDDPHLVALTNDTTADYTRVLPAPPADSDTVP